MKITNTILFKALSLSFFFMGASSCQPSTSKNLDKAVQKNIEAINSFEATTACTDVFNQAQKTDTSEEFCQVFSEKSDTEISICEADIKNPKYSALIKNCRAELLSRLEQLIKKRNEGLSVWANVHDQKPQQFNFKFDTKAVRVDTSLGGTLTHQGLADRQVVLTFDDGPDPVSTISILRTLQAAQAKAHFFQVGYRVKAQPQVTQLVSQMGHSVSNHSWNHPDFKKLDSINAANQIYQTHKIIFDTIKWVDPFFRFPYGSRSVEAEAILKRNKMTSFLWNVDSNDWRKLNSDKSIRTNLQVIEETIAELNKKNKGILLFHDVHQRTAELLPELLKRLHQQNYQIAVYVPADLSLRTAPPFITNNPIP